MKNLLMALFLVLATQAYAQVVEVKKDVTCTTVRRMSDALEQIGEKLMLKGKNEENGADITLFYNVTTKTWTIIESNDRIACILANGEGLNVRPPNGQKPSM